MLHLKRRIYEARLMAYEAQLTLHEAALRAMKRSLFRLHVFFAKFMKHDYFLINKKFLIMQAARDACASYRNEVEMLHIVE